LLAGGVTLLLSRVLRSSCWSSPASWIIIPGYAGLRGRDERHARPEFNTAESRVMVKRCLPLLLLAFGCVEPKQSPGVVRVKPGEVLTRSPGPMPDFGPFATVEDGILAACPLVVSQANAVIPVRRTDQNFEVYWRTAQEYCAWLYAPAGKDVVMSLLAASPVQSDPVMRQCALPAYVEDNRHPDDGIVYLTILHNHPYEDGLSARDLRFLIQMAQLHGFTPSINGHAVSISIVAFLGHERDGSVACAGFYRYDPLPNSELIKVVIDATGQRRKAVIGHVRWNEDGTYEIVR
jgi:hypothetical protein